MSSLTLPAQAFSITVSLLASGGIATLSIFDVREIQSQPAGRALPMIRWLFSRGSHIFPQAAILSAAGFAYLAYDALPQPARSITQLLRTTNGFKVNGYLAAALLTFSIAPWTAQVMIPNNFALIEMNEKLGGARSVKGAEVLEANGVGPGERSVMEVVDGKGEGNELRDLSGPSERTRKASKERVNGRVGEMLEVFWKQNLVRAVLMGGGGFIGLVTALG